MAETSAAKSDLLSTDVRTKIRPSSPNFFICLRLCPDVATKFGPGSRGWDRVARVAAHTRTYRPPVLGNSVLLRNADRKRTRRCVPSAVLIWPADRNHAKIIAQRHPSCESWPPRVEEGIRRMDTSRERERERERHGRSVGTTGPSVFRSGQMLRT